MQVIQTKKKHPGTANPQYRPKSRIKIPDKPESAYAVPERRTMSQEALEDKPRRSPEAMKIKKYKYPNKQSFENLNLELDLGKNEKQVMLKR